MFENDKRTVMTLDAGGTNFVFSAIRGGKEIAGPVHRTAVTDDIQKCLETIKDGFVEIRQTLSEEPAAISFAFPEPADYENGIIGDLPNFPCFRGGVHLGDYLREAFGVPVFINNDGNLYAYGEALCGFLPEINAKLEAAGQKGFRNLLGITFGTGFGAGVVIDKVLLKGDNGCGGDVWLMRNYKYQDMIAEEGVGKRAVGRVYRELTGSTEDLTPKDVFDIAEGLREGDAEAAKASFRELGQTAGNAIISALNIVDGLVVIGGGVSAAAKYIMPGIMDSMRKDIGTFAGDRFPCLQMKPYNLEDPNEMDAFITDEGKKTGVAITRIGASQAIAAGAFAYALMQLDK